MTLCRFDGAVNQFRNALPLECADRHNGNPEFPTHFFDINGTAVGTHLVHHIQCEYHRNVQLEQLHGQIQVALNVGSVRDIDDTIRFLVQDVIAGDNLLLRIGAQRIDPRQVDDRAIRLSADLPDLLLHRHAREVADMATHPRQGIEKRGFPAVLVSGKCKPHDSASPPFCAATGSLSA